jgi:hypothetical protein
MSPRPLACVAGLLAALLVSGAGARADEAAGSPSIQGVTLLDRVVVRWSAPETGGPGKPQFIFERELAFEARLESLMDPDP